MNGFLFCLDPGLRACGVSLWREGELLRAGAVRGPTTGRGPAVWSALAGGVAAWLGPVEPGTVLVEEMKVYVGSSKGDPADLIELAGVAGAVVGRLAGWTAEGVRAADWNGQVPSDIRRKRTAAWIEAQGWTARVDLATTARYQQDVWSAIGIGRWRTTGRR